MEKDDIFALAKLPNDSGVYLAPRQLAHRLVDGVKDSNPGMQTHQAALEVRRTMEMRFIEPHQSATGYGPAVEQGVKQYVARLPAEQQPMAPSTAGWFARSVYNALGAPEQNGGGGIHAVPIAKTKNISG